MNCGEVREFLLALDLDEAGRRRAADALSHLDSCADCRLAMQDFDQIALPLAAHEKTDRVETLQGGLHPDSSSAPSGGWGAFEQRMLAVISQGGHRQVHLPPAATPVRRSRWRLLSTAAAVLIAVAVSLFVAARHFTHSIPLAATSSTPPPDISPIQQPDRIHSDEVRRQIETFAKVNEDSHGQTRWIMVGPGTSDSDSLQLRSSGAGAQTGTGRLLFVRLTLCQGSELISYADLVLVPGVSATVNVPFEHGTSTITYHVASSEADPMHLSVHLELPEPRPAVLATTLQLEPYVNVVAGRVRIGHGAYELKVAAVAADVSAPAGNQPNL